MTQRRQFLILAAGTALSGCGFQPVYMPTASGTAGVAQRELAAIQVAIIGERPGQLLRQALQDRLEMGGGGVQRRYDLRVSYWISGEGLAVQPDNTATRVRLFGHANWSLFAQDPGQTVLAKGAALAIDAQNVFDAQYFGNDLESEAIQRRLAEAVAEQITIQLAVYFRKRAAAVA